MVAEVLPGLYDYDGKRILKPRKHHRFSPRPMGSFLSQPVMVACRNLEDIRRSLVTCRYVSDQEQFGLRDYWMTPQEFERARKGDCDDFALWTWRQLLNLGYEARFVVGKAGRYGEGHAWVTYRSAGKTFVVEPLIASVADFPRLETLRYRPSVSVAAEGTHVRFYEHSPRRPDVRFRDVAPFLVEWALFKSVAVLRTILRRPGPVFRRITRIG